MGKTAGPIPYSDSRIKTIERCLRQYFYTYKDRRKEFEFLTPNLAKGLFIHKRIENFWQRNKDTQKLEQRYKSLDSFLNSAQANFKRFIAKNNSYRGVKINWSDNEEKWRFINKEAKDILSRYYYNSQAEGPPLAVEVPFKIRIDGEDLIVGVIDEIRKKKIGIGLKIRDHKYYPGGLSERHLLFDQQLTIYLLVLTHDLANYGPITRNFLLLDRLEAEKIAGEDILSPNISLEYHLLKENGKIIEVKRTKEHYIDFRESFSLSKQKLDYAKNTGNYVAERGDYCGGCVHKLRCDRDTLEQKTQLVLIPKIEVFDIDKYFIKQRGSRSQTAIRFPRSQVSLEI